MTAPLIQNTENILTKKKNQLDHLASVWSLFSKKPPFLLIISIKASCHKYHLGSLKNPKVNLQLNQLHKNKDTSLHLPRKNIKNILQQYPDYLCIYTDGSKDHNKNSMCSSHKQNNKKQKALLMDSSIFTADCLCNKTWLSTLSRKKKHKKIHHILRLAPLFLLSLNNKKTRAPTYYQKLLCRLHSTLNKEIVFCWIPSHIGVRGKS